MTMTVKQQLLPNDYGKQIYKTHVSAIKCFKPYGSLRFWY